MNKKINIKEKFKKFDEKWSPKIIAQMNDYHFKLAKIEWDFVWHKHTNTDEVFIVIEWELKIDLENHYTILKEWEMFVVPKNIKHKTSSQKECKILMIEPKSTPNTWDTQWNKAVSQEEWI